MTVGELTRYRRWYGRDEPPADLRRLRAGPFDVDLDGPDIRYLRFGDVELVRRVYLAVRDVNWDTIADTDRQIHVEDGIDSFLVSCELRHRRGPVEFAWRGQIEGRADGTIVYEMDGVCQSRFDYAKIGLCVHHPSRESHGRRYVAVTPNGTREGTLPDTIGPQIYLPEEGYDLPLFEPYSSLEIQLESGIAVRFDFEGELFEIEDQRNWTDASFKTASTPASLGYLHHAEAGKRIVQRIAMRCTTGVSRPRPRPKAPVLTLGDGTGVMLPPIGFGVPSDRVRHSQREAELAHELRPAHLRADVSAGDRAGLESALDACRAIGTDLELAVFSEPGADAALDAMVAALAQGDVRVARVLAFQRGAATTPPALVAHVRDRLGPALPGTPFFGGTNVYFCDINRDRPERAGLDGIAYSVNPQIHAFDERSLAESLEGQADTVMSARALFDVPVAVTPVTLRPRFNAVASEEVSASAHELPWQVDPRQMSQFCAVWALGSVKALAEAGAGSLTYFETVGWRGLLERDGGCPMPDLFPSRPGMVFPVHRTFAALRDWAGAELVDLRSSLPLDVVGLALRREGSLRLMVGNLTHNPGTVTLAPFGAEVALEPFALEIIDNP